MQFAGALLKDVGEIDLRFAQQFGADVILLVFDGVGWGHNRVHHTVLHIFKTHHHLFEGGDEAVEGQLVQFARISRFASGGKPRQFMLDITPLEALHTLVLHYAEFFCRRLELLVVEQLSHQILAWVYLIAFFVFFVAGQEQFGLDAHQRGGHQNEFAGQLDVHLLHLVHVLEKIICDPRNRDIVNIELIALNEEQQEIEGSFELGQADFETF
jgi:hypothetical protein